MSHVTELRGIRIHALALATLCAGASAPAHLDRSHRPATRRCTLMPGATLVLLRVERDTTLPFVPAPTNAMSFSGVPRSPSDSLLATAGTPMPAARVRLLQVDATTRRAFVRAGLSEEPPIAFIRAAPYRADCRTIRWTDSIPWVQRGDTGYVRATLAPREQWIGDVPVLVIPDVWNYPYPRRRGLASGTPPDAALASADAMYSLNVALHAPRTVDPGDRPAAPVTTRRVQSLGWARSHPAAAELEPARSMVRRAVLEADWAEVQRTPSRLRGSYRVTMESDGVRATWYFRTHDRPGFTWREVETVRTTASVLASPHVSGYRLVGFAASTSAALLGASPVDVRNVPVVWLATADRPTTPGNDERRVLPGSLEFMLSAAPASLWDHLEAFIPPVEPADSALRAAMNLEIPRAQLQPRLPITLRIDARGDISADTSLAMGGRRLRVSLARVDSVSVKRPF